MWCNKQAFSIYSPSSSAIVEYSLIRNVLLSENWEFTKRRKKKNKKKNCWSLTISAVCNLHAAYAFSSSSSSSLLWNNSGDEVYSPEKLMGKCVLVEWNETREGKKKRTEENFSCQLENCAVEGTFITTSDGKANGMETTNLKIVYKSVELLFEETLTTPKNIFPCRESMENEFSSMFVFRADASLSGSFCKAISSSAKHERKHQ